ncbi:MAG: TadA family conjugal transfer-associated ATPase [Dermatophilaceae bacterium]
MSVTARVWEHIRSGQPPDGQTVESLAFAERGLLGEQGRQGLRSRMASALLGAGPLDSLLTQTGVTDVAVNGDGSVWVEQGAGMQRAPLTLPPDEVRALALRLAALAGRRLDESAAYVDGLLPSGVRLHAILPPLVPDGAHVTLRVPSRVFRSLDDLQRQGAVDPGWTDVLSGLVTRRVSFLVSGGTGAGKTTLLAALLGLCPPRERLVLVEDVRELVVDHPHVVHLEGRAPNVEGAGEVTLRTLVRQALRMRPDRLVVGEVRGAEVQEMLAAMNTGHEGGCGTLHANAASDVVARIEALGALAGLPRDAVHAQLSSAVDVVVHMRRAEGRRVVDSVGVVEVSPAGVPRVVPALTRRGQTAPDRSASDRLAALCGAAT